MKFPNPIPNTPNIQTTVWYGVRCKTVPKGANRKKNNLLRGMQRVCSILLLESMVLLAAGTQWGGSWTQRLYGTGNADLWEITGVPCGMSPNLTPTPVITNTAWQQGWRVLEPLQVANYDNGTHHEVINDTLSGRCPSLVLMQTPPRIWKASCAGSKNVNADKQKRKKIRE